MKKVRLESKTAWRFQKSLFYPGDYRIPEDISLEIAKKMVEEGVAMVVGGQVMRAEETKIEAEFHAMSDKESRKG